MSSARFQAVKSAQNEASSEELEKSIGKNASSHCTESDKDSEDEDSSINEEQIKSTDDVIEVDEEEEEDEDIEKIKDELDDAVDQNSLSFICEALGNFSAEEASDLSFQKGDLLTVIKMQDDGWWEVENQDGEKGLVPSTFLKIPDKIKKLLDGSASASQYEERGNLWGKLRNTVKQAHAFEEALSAMGAFPISFSEPTLSQLLQKDHRYSTEAFLAPKLSETGLSFTDLKWNNDTNSMQPLCTHLQRAVRLVAFRQVRPPESGYEVTSRHVRICLHDGSKVLSNIHTIRANWDSKTPKIWTFQTKNSPGGCLEEGQFFIRSNSSAATIGVLFQLCVSYKKTNSDVNGEMSCGWVFMRLLDDSGLPVPNRTKILNIQSGVPFMSQLSSPLSSGSKEGAIKNFINKSKQPRLVVTVTTLKKKTEQLMVYLPMSLIGTVSSIPLLTYYRKILCDKLLRDRTSFDSTELIQSPFLSNFPKMFLEPDIVDTFRKLWMDKLKKLKQSALKNENDVKACFENLFTETVFLILQCASLPIYTIADPSTEQIRKSQISKILKLVKEHGPLAFAFSPEYRFRPLAIKHLSIDIINLNEMHINGID